MCCGCSPSKLAKRRQEEEWKEEIREMMEKRNKEDTELGLEAEGWQEVNKSKTGPRLEEGAQITPTPPLGLSVLLTNRPAFSPLARETQTKEEGCMTGQAASNSSWPRCPI